MSAAGSNSDSQRLPRGFVVAAVAVLTLLIGFRLCNSSDVYDNAQPGPMAFTVDVAANGQWLMQHEPSGELATKPPLYQWLAALAVLATGSTSEFAFKLPSLIAFLLTTLLIYDLARQSMEARSAIIAPIAWAANYHTFKLMYTARPDMLLTMFIVLAVWAVQRQRAAWAAPDELRPTHGGTQLSLIGVFWFAVTGAAMSKGPPALLPLLYAALALSLDGAWRRCRPGAQLLGLIACLAIVAAWLGAVLSAYPQWLENINEEIVERVSGSGTGAHRQTPFGAIPGYFVTRFAPWSVLCAIAIAAWKRSGTPAARWTLWWIGLVLIFFMIPKGKRADYIVPAYAGGAVLVAAMIDRLVREPGSVSRFLAPVLGAFGVTGVVTFILGCLAPAPRAVNLPVGGTVEPGAASAMFLFAGGIALVAGLVNLAFSGERQLRIKAICGGFVMASILGIYHGAFSRAANTGAGDVVHHLVDRAEQERAGDTPIGFYDVDKTPIAAMLGVNRVSSEAELDIPARGGLLFISADQWMRQRHRYGRAVVLARTGELPEVKRSVMLVRIEPP